MKKILSEYIQAGSELCPHCGSNDITGREIDIRHTKAIHATSDLQCNSCHGVWRDVWLLAAIQIPQQGKDNYLEMITEMPESISEFLDQEWQKKMKTRVVKARNKKGDK